MDSTAADIPDHWGLLPIKDGNVRVASFWGLMESTSPAAPLSAPMTLDSWLSAADGDPSGFWLQSLLAELAFPQAQVWGDVASVARADAGAAERYFSAGQDRGDPNLGYAGSEFIWAGGRLLDAWPADASEDQYDRVQTSEVETLLIGGTLDVATPPGAATEELLPHLPNGHQVVLSELGHSTDFWSYQPAASSRLINTFLDSGTVDDSLYRPAEVDFTPEVTQTAIAKGLLGAMVGFAALAALSRAGRDDDASRRRARRRAARGRDDRCAGRAGHLPRLGDPRPVGQGQGNRARGGDRRRPGRCVARVQRHRGASGRDHHDRRRGRGGEPDAARPRHRGGSPATGSCRRGRWLAYGWRCAHSGFLLGRDTSGALMGDVRVVRPDERAPGSPTPGMAREQAVVTDGLWTGVVHTEAGMVSGWHHHGEYETSIYVLTGSFRMEFGPGGADSLDAEPGDFLYVAPHAIHRERNPSDLPGSAVVVRAGHGEPVINVDAPQPGGAPGGPGTG